MKKENTSLGFRLHRITTEQFAIIKSAYKDGDQTSLTTSLNFGVDRENMAISVIAKFEFDQKKKVFLLIEVACHFLIDESSWDEMLSEKGKVLTLPQGFATHLAVLNVGTARGILHAKTENTPFNQFTLPTINLTEFIKGDVVLEFGAPK